MADRLITPKDITRKRGDTFSVNFVLEKPKGTAVDITGFLFVLTVDPAQEPGSAANNKFSITGVIDDAAAGEYSFTPSTAQAALAPGRYYYDVQLTDAAGALRTQDEGRWIIEQDISK